MDALLTPVLIIGIACGVYALGRWWFDPRTEAQRRLWGEPNVAIAAVRPGRRAKVTGAVAALGPLMKSPIGERDCIGFRLIIEEMSADQATTVFEREACDAFTIRDDSGSARVEGPVLFGLEPEGRWEWLTPGFFGVLEFAGVAKADGFEDHRFRYREALLLPDDRVRVLALAILEPDPSAPPAGFRTPAFGLRLRGSKEERTVIADAVERRYAQAS
jgi:hypothetical protein